MTYFKFLDKKNSYQIDNSFLAIIDVDVKTKEELLKDLYNKLQLPRHFGFNWDALLDCLRDFSWIQNKGIVLIHHTVPNIEESDLKIYLEILNDAIVDWKDSEEHYLEIIFPKSSEDILKTLVNL